jgi:hypothetical protein
LEFTEQIFRGLDRHLNEDGWAQFVLAAPGNQREPVLLRELADKYLAGTTTIRVNPQPHEYASIIQWLCDSGFCTARQGRDLLRRAIGDGVTHMHLCVVQYAPRASKKVTVAAAAKTYHHCQLPLPGLEQREAGPHGSN